MSDPEWRPIIRDLAGLGAKERLGKRLGDAWTER